MPKQLNICVTTPEARVEFQTQSNSTGKQLFDQVARTLGLREIWFFGLQYQDKLGHASWIKMDKRISEHNIKKEEPTQLYFVIKFYPEDVTEELIQPCTQRLFYLQVKKAIINEDIYCPPETSLLLASYQCVVRFGLYDPKIHQPGFINIPNFIPGRVLEQHNLSQLDWEEKIVKWYSGHTLDKDDAMMEYLKIAQDLEMYGVNYFPIKNKKKTDLWLGIDAMGLNVYPRDDKLTPTIGFPWSEIKNINYSDKKVCIRPFDKSSKDFVFSVDRVATSKNILALCVGNHDLYTRRRRADSIEVQQMKAQAKEAKQLRELERKKLMDEKAARECAEQRLREIEKGLALREEEQRRAEMKLQEFQERTHFLENELEQEKAIRLELEEMQTQLSGLNKQLEQTALTSVEEKNRLRDEREAILAEIKQQNTLLEAREKEKRRMEEDLAELKLAFETREDPLAARTNGYGNGDASARASFRSNLLGDEEHEGHEFEEMDSSNRPEDTREVRAILEEDFAKQLKSLKEDLSSARASSKMHALDRRHEDNQRRGLDKFKTLRQIREGNTKRRVEEFESL